MALLLSLPKGALTKANTFYPPDTSFLLHFVYTGECTGESFPMAGPEKFQCTFTGIYPEGTIHWFHNDDNVTSYSNITSLPNTDGTFNITSVLQLPHTEHMYNCFLMLPINGQYIEMQQLALRSGINRHHCSWTLLLIGLILRIFLLLSSL